MRIAFSSRKPNFDPDDFGYGGGDFGDMPNNDNQGFGSQLSGESNSTTINSTSTSTYYSS